MAQRVVVRRIVMEADCTVLLDLTGITSSRPVACTLSRDGELAIRKLGTGDVPVDCCFWKVDQQLVGMNVTEVVCKGIGKLGIASASVLCSTSARIEVASAAELELSRSQRFGRLLVLARGTAQVSLGFAVARHVQIRAAVGAGIIRFCAVETCFVTISGCASVQGQAGRDCKVTKHQKSALSAVDIVLCERTSPPASPVKI